MSFSSKAKNNLARNKSEGKCCQKSELSALIRVSGSIGLKGLNHVVLTINTENAAVARLIFTLFKKVYQLQTEVIVNKQNTFKKSNMYSIQLDDAREILQDLEILSKQGGFLSINEDIPSFTKDKDCCKRAYLRGIFLGGGSVSDPEKGYHLELITHSEGFCEHLVAFISDYELKVKYVERKGNYVVYMKEGDSIVDFLNIIGAHATLLKFEDIRIIKQVRNNVNRVVNCETANLNKVIDAAYTQIEAIEKIHRTIGISALKPKLIEVAELRLDNPDISLKELGELLDPPVGKSGVNHRLKKIVQIADDIDEG